MPKFDVEQVIIRRDDWAERFAEVEDTRADMAWSWTPPRHDCLSASCTLLSVMTGHPWRADCLARFGGGLDYDSEADAADLSTIVGGYEMVVRNALNAILGERYESVRSAHRGDPALVDGQFPFGVALGVVDLTGESVLTASPRGGWDRVPLADARAAWSLPF